MTLRITTFNVGLLDIWLFGRRVFEFPPFARERAAIIPKILSRQDTDIFCLQELYRSGDYAQIANALAPNYPFAFRGSRTSSMVFEKGLGPYLKNTGLAVFSKFPLTEGEEHFFRDQTLGEMIMGRHGFQLVTVALSKNRIFKLANVHTTAGGIFGNPEDSTTTRIRQKQLCELTETISAKTNASWVIAGDLNCSPTTSSENFMFLEKIGAVDPCAGIEDRSFDTWDKTNLLVARSWHRKFPSQRIDHILLSRSLHQCCTARVRRLFDEPLVPIVGGGLHVTLSDHYGIELYCL